MNNSILGISGLGFWYTTNFKKNKIMFKPGEIVYVKSAHTGYEYIFIFKSINYSHVNSYYTYDLQDKTGSDLWQCLMLFESFQNARLATDAEKEILLTKLFSQGKTFDKETLQIVDNEEI